MLEKGWEHSELGIYNNTIQIFPSPAVSPFSSSPGPGFCPPLFLCPGPSVMFSASLSEGPNHLLPPSGSRTLRATLFQSPPLNPTLGVFNLVP